MRVSEMRTRLTTAVKRGLATSFTATECDYALQGAFHDLDLTGRVNRQEDSFNFQVGNPEVDMSVVIGLRPDRVVRIELGYRDRGAWSSASVSYLVNDLVSNDDKFYVCATANTSSASNEPGSSSSSSVWVLRNWKRGDVVEVQTYDTVARMLGDRDSYRRDSVNSAFVRTDNESRGKPSIIGAMTVDKWYCYPVPDIAYPGVVIQENPVDEWVAGGGNPDIDLPLAVLLPVIDLGAAYRLDARHPDAQNWKAQWMEMKDRIRGKLIIATGMGIKDEALFRDFTDEWSGWVAGSL